MFKIKITVFVVHWLSWLYYIIVEKIKKFIIYVNFIKKEKNMINLKIEIIKMLSIRVKTENIRSNEMGLLVILFVFILLLLALVGNKIS